MNKSVRNITHLSLSGGGFKGICYLGIMRYFYLENMIDNLKYISGSSIGALFAVCFALEIPVEYLEEEFINILDSCENDKLVCIDKNALNNLFITNGMCDVSFMTNVLKKYLKKKYDIEDITFLDLIKKTGKNVYISATNINKNCNVLFSAEATPDVSVISAIHASMTIPLMFQPIQIDDEYYIDGVLSNDMPCNHYKNIVKEQFLGIILCSNFDLSYPKIEMNLITYLYRSILSIYVTLMEISYQREINNPFVLKIKDIPYKNGLEFKTKDNDIIIDLTREKFDDLILKGFIDITDYMYNRYNHKKL